MTQKPHILVVDDEVSMRDMVSILLKRHGYEVTTANSGKQVSELLVQKKEFDLVVTDLLMDHGGGIEVLMEVKETLPNTEVIVFTAFGTPETAVEAMKQGAFDYITKPFNVDEFLIVVRQALEHRTLKQENVSLRAQIRGEYKFADIVGRSAAIKNVITICQKVADSPATVLIFGESGTGKEVVARAIHFSGIRSDKPFVAVNCGALPEQLMESELFGHLKGAFTGALENKEGLLLAADTGTVFLDEIGELPMPLQVKLLRILEDRMVRPVGSSKEIPVDLRVIAATNRNLAESVKNGEFRKDLYYRLNVLNVHLPPLREREEDVPLLVDHLLNRLAARLGQSRPQVSSEVMRILMRYDYPGNVRELANILERAITLASSDHIIIDDLPPEVVDSNAVEINKLLSLPPNGVNLEDALEDVERNLINQALVRTGGIRTKAASILGVSFRSFRYRLNKLGIVVDDETNN